MSVSLVIPSRGRPELLGQAVNAALSNATLDTTRIVVGLDTDDETTARIELPIGVIRSIAEREDSLGAKYNRCQRAHRADLYVLGSDDVAMITPGWDAKLDECAKIFPDQIGAIYFSDMPGVFQAGQAVTHRLVVLMGYLCQPYTPFWWHDTWLDEIAQMIGRIVKPSPDVRMEAIGPIAKSRGLREIAYWAKFFDNTRPQRREIADLIIEVMNHKAWARIRADMMLPMFEYRNSILRNPDKAASFEQNNGFDAPADERYLRIKAVAAEILKAA